MKREILREKFLSAKTFYERMLDYDLRTVLVFDAFERLSDIDANEFNLIMWRDPLLYSLCILDQQEAGCARRNFVSLLKEKRSDVLNERSIMMLYAIALEHSDRNLLAPEMPEEELYMVRFNAVATLKEIYLQAPEILPTGRLSLEKTLSDLVKEEPSMAVRSMAQDLLTKIQGTNSPQKAFKP